MNTTNILLIAAAYFAYRYIKKGNTSSQSGNGGRPVNTGASTPQVGDDYLANPGPGAVVHDNLTMQDVQVNNKPGYDPAIGY